MLAVEIPFLAFVKKVGKDAHVPRVSVIIVCINIMFLVW